MSVASIQKLDDDRKRLLFARFSELDYFELFNPTITEELAKEFETNTSTISSQRLHFTKFQSKGGDAKLYLSGLPREQCYVQVREPEPAPEPVAPHASRSKSDLGRIEMMRRLELAAAFMAFNTRDAASKEQQAADTIEHNQSCMDLSIGITDAYHHDDQKKGADLTRKLSLLQSSFDERGGDRLEKERERLQNIAPLKAPQLFGKDIPFDHICKALGVDFGFCLEKVLYRNLAGFVTEEQEKMLADLAVDEEQCQLEEAKEEQARKERQEATVPPQMQEGPKPDPKW